MVVGTSRPRPGGFKRRPAGAGLVRNPYWLDALLVVATLGVYAFYWLWRSNRDLRDAFPRLDLDENAGWVVAGVGVSLAGNLLAFSDLPLVPDALIIGGVLLCAAGVFVLLRNGETAAEAEQTPWRAPPALVAGLFAGAFIAIHVGTLVPSLLVRGPALLLLALLPFAFYYVHEDLDTLHAAREAHAAPPLGGVTS